MTMLAASNIESVPAFLVEDVVNAVILVLWGLFSLDGT